MWKSFVFRLHYRSHGHSCDHDRLSIIFRVCGASQGGILRLIGEKPMGKREEDGSKSSCAYTQTIVRLYANDCATIPDLKELVVYCLQFMSSTIILLLYFYVLMSLFLQLFIRLLN